MKVLKGCLIKWVIFLGMGLGICSLLIAADIEYGDFFMPFFTFMIGLTAVVGLIIFLISMLIFGITDFFGSGTAKEWWDAAKEGKTIYQKQNEKRRR